MTLLFAAADFNLLFGLILILILIWI